MNNNEQNGRQPTTELAAPPTDPRTRNIPSAPETLRICRDYVWGICLMNEQCRYRHELEFDSMKTILKFCHDFQNRTGCARPDCTYLHTSREEENLFLTSGQIPRVLAERYASMSAVPAGATQESTPVPVQTAPGVPMIYMNDYITQPPPPPPPPPNSSGQPLPPPGPVPAPITPVSTQITPSITAVGQMQGALSSAGTMSMNSTMSGGPMHPAMSQMPIMMASVMPVSRTDQGPTASAIIQPPMQSVISSGSNSLPAPMTMPTLLAPPPPPPPPTVSSTSAHIAVPVYTVPPPGQQPSATIFPVAPCRLLPADFDPSKPPPSFLSICQQSRGTKRSSAGEIEAGPSKSRKVEETVDGICEYCIEREIRSELLRQEIDKLQREEEYQRLLHERKMEEYENGRLLLRSMLSEDLFNLVDEFIEAHAHPPHTHSQNNDLFSSNSPLYSTNHQNVPRQLLIQIVDYIVNSAKKNNEPAPPPTPSLEAITRRATQENEAIASVLDILRNSGGGASENRSSSVEPSGANGLARFTNGPVEGAGAGVGAAAPRYPGALPPGPVGSPRYAAPQTAPPPALPSRPFAPPDQPPYVAYPPAPAVPPPRPYYPTYPAAAPAPNNNAPYHSVVMPQVPPRPTTPAPTVNGQTFAQFLARLPYLQPPFQ